MKNEIRYELFISDKFTKFEYQVNMTIEERKELDLYRAELVNMLDSETSTLSIPPRPSIFDRYK